MIIECNWGIKSLCFVYRMVKNQHYRHDIIILILGWGHIQMEWVLRLLDGYYSEVQSENECVIIVNLK